MALGERDAKDRAVDHQIGVLRRLREEIAAQGETITLQRNELLKLRAQLEPQP